MSRLRPFLGVLALAAALAAATARASTVPPPAPTAVDVWDRTEVATVVGRGLMGPSVDDFRPGEALTAGDLWDALAAWGHPYAPPPDRAATVSIRELDARLVVALGLQDAARTIRVAARDAGLEPIPSLGTETVARLLGLRLNHPAAEDDLELLPSQPATRAEAAYSLARALALTDGAIQQVAATAATFTPPRLTDWERTVLTRALRFVGYPYVWTGTSEHMRQTLWNGLLVPGGFDCSGFVWRVYKLQAFAGAPALAATLKGRTTYAMSGEVPRALRLPVESLEPADVVFFGSQGPRSTPDEVGHMGIALGNGWFVHSSGHGVTLDPLTGWYATRFAWARRPIAEAGLEPEPAVDTVAVPAT